MVYKKCGEIVHIFTCIIMYSVMEMRPVYSNVIMRPVVIAIIMMELVYQ